MQNNALGGDAWQENSVFSDSLWQLEHRYDDTCTSLEAHQLTGRDLEHVL